MSGTLTATELTGLRADMDALVGVDEDGNDLGRTTIKIEREGAKGSLNETTGQYTETWSTLYEGAALVFPIVYRRERQESLSATMVRVRMYRVLIPWDAQGDAGDFRANDRITIVTCDDADFVGKTIRVTDIMHESDQATRRLSGVDWDKGGTEEYA